MKNIDLMQPLEVLEVQLDDAMRNLYPADPAIPRKRWPEVVEKILKSQTLPDDYARSAVWKNAHALYHQIQAMKGVPGFTLWHPV